MFKRFFYLSLGLFILVSALPFIRKPRSYLKPLYSKNIEKVDTFYTTALNSKYTQKNEVNFTYAEDVNKDAPIIKAKSALALDLKTKKIYFAKNEKERKPVASLAKVMTALLAVEHSRLDSIFTVSKNATEIGENVMGVSEGEKYTLEELLYGLILNSGNDAAVTIAENLAGSEESFVRWMNIKASLLGATDTLFADSSGLNKFDKPFYSTALDMAKIAYYSQTTQPSLKDIYATVNKTLPANKNHKALFLDNQTNLLTTYPGVKGMKTGYTQEAGLCLISYAENEGKDVLVVILDSTDRRGDAILLLDYIYSRLGLTIEHNLLEN